ncbi:zinc finger CCHC domain-containing protein 17 [Microcaecilia unicolor]|uniref:Zinc finger CCHC domain-containing protein 17 n=1 Tax=Microcaecilia unicolor TaxID=1415580 RepID=A0A6P7ZLF9_9AMPH|nr:nucleolar protein of 40 kDa [Microcaecilia unicolor]
MSYGRSDNMESLPKLYDIFKGEVATITEYGAFIKIPGCSKQGLVHKTHMSSCRVEKPSEIVDIGEKVWVKVIGIETKDGKTKVSLSMKTLNQGTGKDLDPNNVILDQDQRKKRQFQDYSKQKITLEAVLNTVCKKCGCKGHFAKECFLQPGGIKYSLVPEEEEEEEETQPEHPSKKRKKEKKKRKKTKGHETASDAESSASENEAGPSATKHRKHSMKSRKKKHKKHGHKE